MKKLIVVLFVLAFSFSSCAQPQETQTHKKGETMSVNQSTAVFGGGCFWCVEAIFQEMNGVTKVVSGYSGGTVSNPTYRQVCDGNTGHAEVTKIIFDSTVVSFTELLEVFFSSHDPTQMNRQGADVGTQYRSVVFYTDDQQKEITLSIIKELNEQKVYSKPIVTEVSPLKEFYPAEDYHQNYFANNPNQGYCQFVIVPKLEKFKKIFKDKLKSSH